MRISKACLQCRTGKRKCSSLRIGGPCNPCIQRRLQCSNQLTRPRYASSGLSTSQTTCDAIKPPYNDEILHLVDLYFEYIHDKPHSLFHVPSFKASVVDGTVSRTVLLSIIGLSARFAEDAEVRARGLLYATEAKACFKADFERACIENIQASIVIANIYLADSDSRAESLYYAIAIRMAQILDLASINDEDDGISREIKRRIWWTCFLVDIWSSGGSSLSRQLSITERRPRVPMEELMFLKLRPQDEDVPELIWRPGIWAHMVGMVEIYKEIQDLIRYLVVITEWDENFIETTVHELAVRLLDCEERFGTEIQFSPENLEMNARRGLGRLYTGFHLGYQYYCMLLFYQYLDKNRPPTRNGNAYADRCKMHARKFCDILKISREYERAEALHNIIAHITVVSSSVLLHTYMFGDASELEDTKLRLESNLEGLVRLRKYWPSAELMINRLVVFLKSCVRSSTNNTHRFDKWMVKFLQEYAMTLDEKDEYTDPPPITPDVHEPGLGQRSRTIQNVISTFGMGPASSSEWGGNV